MAVGLACSAACQRVFSCYSVGARHIPSVKIGFLSFLVFWIPHFAANQSLLLVQRAAAADMSTVSESFKNAQASAPFGRDSYDDRSEENQNDSKGVNEFDQSTSPDATKKLRGSTLRQQDDLTGLEGNQDSLEGNWSNTLDRPTPYTSSRAAPVGIGHPGTQHTAGGYDVPFSQERETREETVPGSSPWGGEEREEEAQPQPPFTAAEEGNESWLKPEETLRAGRDSSRTREKSSVALEEGEKQESNGTATAARLRLSQRGRTLQKPTSNGAPRAHWSDRLRSRKFLLQTLLPIVGFLVVMGGGLYGFRARSWGSSAGKQTRQKVAPLPAVGAHSKVQKKSKKNA